MKSSRSDSLEKVHSSDDMYDKLAKEHDYAPFEPNLSQTPASAGPQHCATPPLYDSIPTHVEGEALERADVDEFSSAYHASVAPEATLSPSTHPAPPFSRAQGPCHLLGELLKSPMTVTVALTSAFHNAPALYGDTTVRQQPEVTGSKSGFTAAYKVCRHSGGSL